MAREGRQDLKGPLSDEALAVFEAHLSVLNGHAMVFDPEAAGTEMYHQGTMGRYQFKVAGGRTSDHQGVALKVTQDPEIYLIRENRIVVIVRVAELDWRDADAALLADVDLVLSPNFRFVLRELMEPYRHEWEKAD